MPIRLFIYGINGIMVEQWLDAHQIHHNLTHMQEELIYMLHQSFWTFFIYWHTDKALSQGTPTVETTLLF